MITPESTDPIVYIPVPVSEKPEKEGYYGYIHEVSQHHQTAYWTGEEWRYYRHVPQTGSLYMQSWLRPTPLSSITNERIKELEAKNSQLLKDGNTLGEMQSQSMGRVVDQIKKIKELEKEVKDLYFAIEIRDAMLNSAGLSHAKLDLSQKKSSM